MHASLVRKLPEHLWRREYLASMEERVACNYRPSIYRGESTGASIEDRVASIYRG
jgi:hypothetical protein